MTAKDKPNVAQLRGDIDAGRTGDKVGGFDPAASPLGTDDEAAGTPPSAEAVALAISQERTRGAASANANAAEPKLQPNAAHSPGPRVMPALVGAAAGAALVILAALILL
jgi:hypothetical protein